MRIYIDRAKLAAYGLIVQDVEEALRQQNVLIPAGRIESRQREFSVVSSTDLQTVEQFRNVVVANVKGYPVSMSDVADVRIAPLADRMPARFKGQAIRPMGIPKKPKPNHLQYNK